MCLRLGYVDVMAFMESVDSRVLDFWDCYDSMYPLNPTDSTLMQHAGIMTMVQRFMAMFASANGVTMDIMHENDFLPKRLRYKVEHGVQTSSDIEQKVVSGLRLIK